MKHVLEDARLRFYKYTHDYLREQTLGPLKGALPSFEGREVLELGCGPGTHAAVLQHSSRYVGIDIEDTAITMAQASYPQSTFLVGDITAPLPADLGSFDCVMIHSVLHHLDDAGVEGALRNVAVHLKKDGTFYLLDLLMPTRFGPAYLLAKLDRGDFPRSEQAWREFVEAQFQIEELERYEVKVFGITGWQMLYLQARTLE